MPHSWTDCRVAPSASVRDAISAIDQGQRQIALVIGNDGKLLGTVSDGDIRRGLLRGLELNAPITLIMNEKPVTARPDDNRQRLEALMREHGIHQLPLLDDDGRVVGLSHIDDLAVTRHEDTIVVLMAGGLGARMRPLTDTRPKPMLHAQGKPILEAVITTIRQYGFRRFFISVNYLADTIVHHFGDGQKWGVEISYVRESKRLGTAGALSLLPERPHRPFLMMNGDILTNVNFKSMLLYHGDSGAPATMAVTEYEHTIPFGVVDVKDNHTVSIVEKPTKNFLVNAGIYVLNPEVLDLIPPDQEIDMPSVMRNLILQGRPPATFLIREFWADIGRPDDLHRINAVS
jgi:dTDP-glucose pyrophosphorylase